MRGRKEGRLVLARRNGLVRIMPPLVARVLRGSVTDRGLRMIRKDGVDLRTTDELTDRRASLLRLESRAINDPLQRVKIVGRLIAVVKM